SFQFYQDTLVTSEDKNGSESSENGNKSSERPSSPVSKEELEDEVAKAEEAINQVLLMENKKNVEREKNRLARGILVYVKKRKGPKKSVQWKPDKDLEATRYFELDETERVNVTKPFTDMKQMERIDEREHILLSRKLSSDDIMEERTTWRSLIPVDIPGDHVVPGKNSVEKDIQYARERTTLQAIYFNRRMIPDSPSEPDLEIHAYTEPAVIPLHDQTGNAESVISYKDRPWPEPKDYPPGVDPAGMGDESPPQQPQLCQPQQPILMPQQHPAQMMGGPGVVPPYPQGQPIPPGPPYHPMGPFPPGTPTPPFNPMAPHGEWMVSTNHVAFYQPKLVQMHFIHNKIIIVLNACIQTFHVLEVVD
ncbi:hypothetical protein AAG570_001685, partial [Ranatra chinensis]